MRACYHVAGRFDYLLHVAVRDLEHLGHLIKYDIAAIPGVDKVETMLVLLGGQVRRRLADPASGARRSERGAEPKRLQDHGAQEER